MTYNWDTPETTNWGVEEDLEKTEVEEVESKNEEDISDVITEIMDGLITKVQLELLHEQLVPLYSKDQVYGRDFMLIAREIVQIDPKINCPLTPEQLDVFKLSKDKEYENPKCTNFTSNWSPRQNQLKHIPRVKKESTETTNWKVDKDSEKTVENKIEKDLDVITDNATVITDMMGELTTKVQLEMLHEQLVPLYDKDQVYSREFMLISREIVQIDPKIKCPLSQEELDHFKLDKNKEYIKPRITNRVPWTLWQPQSKRFNREPSGFTPGQKAQQIQVNQRPWSSNQRQTWKQTQPTEFGDGSPNAQSSNSPPQEQPLERVVFQSSPGAWKAVKLREQVEVEDEEEEREREVCRKITAIFNKVTPTTKNIFIKLLNSLDLPSNPKLLKVIVKLLIRRLIRDPLYGRVYIELCSSITEKELETNVFSLFRNYMLFELRDCNFLGEKDYPKEKYYQKYRWIGIITLISNLYRSPVFNLKITRCMILQILKLSLPDQNGEVDNLELSCALHFLRITEQMPDDYLDEYVWNDWYWELDEVRAKISDENYNLLCDLARLSQEKWVTTEVPEWNPMPLEEDVRRDRQRAAENKKRVEASRKMDGWKKGDLLELNEEEGPRSPGRVSARTTQGTSRSTTSLEGPPGLVGFAHQSSSSSSEGLISPTQPTSAYFRQAPESYYNITYPPGFSNRISQDGPPGIIALIPESFPEPPPGFPRINNNPAPAPQPTGQTTFITLRVDDSNNFGPPPGLSLPSPGPFAPRINGFVDETMPESKPVPFRFGRQ